MVPGPDQIFPPADYAQLAQDAAPRARLKVNSQEGLARSYSTSIMNDVLGRISNMHLAICDMLPGGACEDLAIELSKAQSVAVDSAKTGKTVEIPAEALEMIRRRGYPDFMTITNTIYISEKTLGKIYHRANEAVADNLPNLMDSQPDPTLLIEGHQSYLMKARTVYEVYCSDLKSILNKFHLQHEEELFLGRAFEWHPLFESNKGKAMLVTYSL